MTSVPTETYFITDLMVTEEGQSLTTTAGKNQFSSTSSIISEPSIKHRLSVRPNPAQDLIYVDDLGVDEEVFIYDVIGKLQMNTTSRRIDISKLEQGVYFIKTKDSVPSKFLKM